MKKMFFIGLILVASLMLVAVPLTMAWQEGPGTNWWYIDASYGGWKYSVPLEIQINGDPSDGQTFNIGDIITITGYVHSYAGIATGWSNEAETNVGLDVSGPSGSDSDTAGGYDFNNDEHAEVDTSVTLTIASYTLTTPGTHTVYMYSSAAVASWWAGVDVDDFVEDLMTFEVVEPIIIVGIDIKPGSDPNSINLGSKGMIPVAILSTASFDAATVDPDTVFLDGAGVGVRGKGNKLMASIEDVNDDGRPDLVVHIDTSGLPLLVGETVATLTGETFGGIPIMGTDTVRIVPPE